VAPTGGRVVFDGQDVTDLDKKQLRALRRRMAMIFQDPMASLNPRRSIATRSPSRSRYTACTRAGRRGGRRVGELLEIVGLNPDYRNRYLTSSPVACHLYGVEGEQVERSPHPDRGEGGEDMLVATPRRPPGADRGQAASATT